MEITRTNNPRKVLVVRGDLNSYSGYSHATRLYLKWLESYFDIVLGVDLHSHPSRHIDLWPYPLINDDWISSITFEPDVELTVLTISTPDYFRNFLRARNIGLFFWETTRLGNEAWIANMNGIDEIWVPAEFMRPMLKAEGMERPIVYRPCPIPDPEPISADFMLPSIQLRKITGSSDEAPVLINLAQVRQAHEFVLLSTNSLIPRKGFPVLAHEWLKVRREHLDAALILKVSTIDITKTPDDLYRQVEALFTSISRQYEPGELAVYVCADSLSYSAMQALGRICDGFLTMSFGEGLGLGLFENLLSGKPVICPRHTSFEEFLPADYPYFIETEVANYGLADPVGVNPISAHWGVPREGSLLGAVHQLISDSGTDCVDRVIESAVVHFRKVCSPVPLESNQ